MAVSLRPLRDQVIVITGASSGIGPGHGTEGGQEGRQSGADVPQRRCSGQCGARN